MINYVSKQLRSNLSTEESWTILFNLGCFTPDWEIYYVQQSLKRPIQIFGITLFDQPVKRQSLSHSLNC